MKKLITFLCYFTGEDLVWTIAQDIPSHWKRVPSEDKEVEVTL